MLMFVIAGGVFVFAALVRAWLSTQQGTTHFDAWNLARLG